MTALLDARHIGIGARLNPTDITFNAGDLVALVGPNGAGKTSLLRALAGIEVDSGTVAIAGEDLRSAPPPRRMRLVSFLPATRSLVWPIAVEDVISLGLPTADPERVAELIATLGLENLRGRPVNHLSTGERSRVLLARALSPRPNVLLLDEPLAHLDPYWVLKVLELLQRTAESGCAVIASLHDLGQLDAFPQAILVDKGLVIADGPAEGLLESRELAEAFGIEREGGRWRMAAALRPAAGRQSSQ